MNPDFSHNAPPPPSPAIAPDPGPFETISNSFFLPGGNYFAQKSFFVKGTQFYGIAVASPAAIYFVKLGSAGGGPGLIRKTLYEVLAKESTLSSCTVRDLPKTIRDYIDPGNGYSAEEVVVLPKKSISHVNSDFMTSSIKFIVGKETFSIVVSIFSIRKRNRQLRSLGWKV